MAGTFVAEEEAEGPGAVVVWGKGIFVHNKEWKEKCIPTL